jgi:L-Ala-D/L-Glu epimerase
VSLRLSQVATRRDLSRSARNAHSLWATRTARIINLENEHGVSGRGEAAPLPGFSPDRIEDCERALNGLDLRDLPAQLEPAQSLLEELARASARLPSELPAARAALETALLELWARAAGLPAWALLTGSVACPKPRRVAALLMGEPEDALAQALSARDRGVTAFKLKVGRAGLLERELAACARLRAELGTDVELRLDANRAWSTAVVDDHLRRFAALQPEFVEEPCALADLAALTPNAVPLALDESLTELRREPAALAALVRSGVCALILKPTLLGGISACCAWAALARESGVQVILSHAFEGPLGLAASAALALSIGSDAAAHGLDLEGARLEHLELPFFSKSQIHAWSAPGFGELELGA